MYNRKHLRIYAALTDSLFILGNMRFKILKPRFLNSTSFERGKAEINRSGSKIDRGYKIIEAAGSATDKNSRIPRNTRFS